MQSANISHEPDLINSNGNLLLLSKAPVNKKNNSSLGQSEIAKKGQKNLFPPKLSTTSYGQFMQVLQKKNIKDLPFTFQWIKIPEVAEQENQEESMNLNFSSLSYQKPTLIQKGSKVIHNFEFVRKNFSITSIKRLFFLISQNYNIVSYHNFSHAYNLFQLLYSCFEAEKQAYQIYSDEQIVFSLFSAICHDIGHSTFSHDLDGTNNNYEIKMKSNWSRIANNESVLQKMHIRKCFSLLQKNPDLDLVKKSSCPKNAKNLIIKLILATDMAQHFSQIQSLKKVHDEKDEKYKFLQNLIHACDIGHFCLNFRQYLNWAALLTYQFQEQAKLQMEKNLEVTKFFLYKNQAQFFNEQISFMKGFVYPLWKQLGTYWPALNPLILNIENNLKKIKEKKENSN